jgi:chromodomain-helicase-DNA-binding protein 1
LNAILKFGAEELFKEDENDGEDNCDIDEILRRAETHEEAARPGDELLSAFKVASFSVNEEEELPEPARFDPYSEDPPSQQDNKDWEQIIPEDIRIKIDAEQKEKEMAELFLPPRSSRNAAATDAKGQPLGNEALNRKAKNRKRKRGADKESEEEESDSESGSPSPKKKGRPKHGKGKGKDFLKFTDPEVKKFLKSLKKFPVPLLRIDKIAEDCGMVDKSHADLKKLAELLLSGCEVCVKYNLTLDSSFTNLECFQEAIAEQKANPQPIIKEEPLPPPAEGDPVKKRPNKPREKGPIFRVCGSAINARTMSIAIEELQVLGQIVPVEESARKNWKIDLKLKTTGFDVEWGQDEDTRLLLGIWEFGNGAYDKIVEADPVLKEKVFLEGEKKPLLKDIRTRADYLIRSLKKLKLTLKPKPVKPAKKKREPKAKKSAEAISGDPSAPAAAAENGTGKGKKAKGVKKVSKKKEKGPMHFAAQTEPTSIAVLGNLDPLIFNECKEKMRPVKKSLKTLDNPDKNLSETDQIKQTKSALIEIGQRIETCLKIYSDSEEIKKWKR